jgi:predicted restriction endonuclease
LTEWKNDRRELKKQKPKSSYEFNAGLIQSESSPTLKPANPRYIPIELRRQDLEKYDYRCNFHSVDGASAKRCPQKRFLDIDHIRPVNKKGKTELSNLQPLCSQTTIAP